MIHMSQVPPLWQLTVVNLMFCLLGPEQGTGKLEQDRSHWMDWQCRAPDTSHIYPSQTWSELSKQTNNWGGDEEHLIMRRCWREEIGERIRLLVTVWWKIMGLDTPFSINATFLLSRGILSFLFSPSQISRSVLSVLVSVGNCLQSQLPAAALYLAQSLSFAQLTIRILLCCWDCPTCRPGSGRWCL